MRMFLILLLVFYPLCINAASGCTDITGTNAQTTCENTPGCHWENTCRPCAEDNYCRGVNNEQMPCSTVGDSAFILSDVGASSENECYKNLTCKKFDGSDDTTCRHYYSNNGGTFACKNGNSYSSTIVHNEEDSCYYNRRNCNLFNTSNCNGGAVGGVAVWRNNTWILNDSPANTGYIGCVCTDGNFTNNTCTGKRTTRVSTASVSQADNTISVEYNGTIERYYCTSCNSGYYIKEIKQNSASTGCIAPYGTNVICECAQVEPGYYRKDPCTWSYDDNGLPNNITVGYCRNACPAGQTTDGPGATSSNDCHYGDDTKLCDSTRECILLKDVLTGVSAADWKPY